MDNPNSTQHPIESTISCQQASSHVLHSGEGGMGVVYEAQHTKLKRIISFEFLVAGQAG
jgi:hypothetical protein